MLTSKNRAKLKSLQTIKSNTQAEIDSLKLQQKQLKKEIKLKTDTIHSINRQIKNLSKGNKELTVSEHAILRYIERVMGVDLKVIEDKILPENKKQIIKTLGDGKYPIEGEEFKVVVKDNLIVTIITDKEKNNEEVK